MKNTMLIVFVTGALFCGAGCAETTCAKICDSCGDDVYEDCKEECKEDYADGNAECREALRDLADCVDDHGCGLSCFNEVNDWASDCG
jgi:hypothetical protein